LLIREPARLVERDQYAFSLFNSANGVIATM
jgi:hypothetical protein